MTGKAVQQGVSAMTPGRAASSASRIATSAGSWTPSCRCSKCTNSCTSCRRPANRYGYVSRRAVRNLRGELAARLIAIEGYYASGYGARGDALDKTVAPDPGAVRDAQLGLHERPEALQRFARVAERVEGFESPFGLELLATVHWIDAHEHPTSDEQLFRKRYVWAERKRQFSPNQISVGETARKSKGGWPRRSD